MKTTWYCVHIFLLSWKVAIIKIWKVFESILFGKQTWIYFQNVAFNMEHIKFNTFDCCYWSTKYFSANLLHMNREYILHITYLFINIVDLTQWEKTMHTLETLHTFWIFEFYTIICSHSYVSMVWGISDNFGGIQ